MGAISVLARSRWSALAAQNMVKVKKTRFFEIYVFRCLGMFGDDGISVPVGGRIWLSELWGCELPLKRHPTYNGMSVICKPCKP